jgi:predicted N-acetyltransferase YhbS
VSRGNGPTHNTCVRIHPLELTGGTRREYAWRLTREELLLECFGEAGFAPGDVVLEVRAGEDVLSHVDIYWRAVGVGSAEVPVAAIGQVCTDPAFRGLGFATSLVAASHRLAAARGVAWAALFGVDPLYTRLGYRQPAEPPDEDFLVCPLAEGLEWPPGPVDTRGEW